MPSLKRLARRAARRLISRYRHATWRSRPLPSFIIVGAQKAGTSSLFGCLAQHPHLSPAFTKEIHFFDGGLNPDEDTYARGSAWYRGHFPTRAPESPVRTFECSPDYICNPLVPGRIHDLIPRAKLIMMLRNPTERAISHYFHTKRRGHDEPLPIGEALRAEEKRLEPILKNQDYKSEVFLHQAYKYRGLYRSQLERFGQLFPPEQTLVLNSEEFFAGPREVLPRVFEFVGVEPTFQVGDLRPRNVGGTRREVPQDVYDYLNEYFRPHNRALYEMVGRDYGW